MASISQGIVLTTAMLVSSTFLYLAFSMPKATPLFLAHGNSDSHHSNRPTVRSCLYSEEKKRERKLKKKNKKKVQFAENVKEAREEEQRKQNRVSNNCKHERSESRGMPPNRIALYNGILMNRVHRMEFSY